MRGVKLRQSLASFCDHALQGAVVKVYVGNRGEQSVHQQLVGIAGALILCRLSNGNQHAGQLILQVCGRAFLAADPLYGAGLTARCLLALKTKHLTVHFTISLICLYFNLLFVITSALYGALCTL